MQSFNPVGIKKLFQPAQKSYKGQNGKLTIIGGSRLFHGASLWSLKVASRIVDMVFYASVEDNNELIKELKRDLYDFIAVPRSDLDRYIEESDVILLGPGLPRAGGEIKGEEPTKQLTERLLKKYPNKRWVIDAGSLTEIDSSCLEALFGDIVITPHHKEFRTLFKKDPTEENLKSVVKKYHLTILLKGMVDIVCDSNNCVKIVGGNQGMTKGGTGDVLAGLVAALFCKNNAFLAACVGSYINKSAGDLLYKKVGVYYNASDLADEIPKLLHRLTQ